MTKVKLSDVILIGAVLLFFISLVLGAIGNDILSGFIFFGSIVCLIVGVQLDG